MQVELNAMTSDQFITWLETKLIEAGVEKVIPDNATLASAYQRAARIAQLSQAITKALDGLDVNDITVPDDLADRLRDAIADSPTSWDQALWRLVKMRGDTKGENRG
jgi:hypothetical protein